jgi:DNA-binding protein HU-beta
MNKAKMIEVLSNRLGIPKRQAEEFIEAFVDIVTDTLKQREEVTLAGFGTFMAKFRSSRMGVNPQAPSESMRIPAVIIPKFKAGKNLKDALKSVPAEE